MKSKTHTRLFAIGMVLILSTVNLAQMKAQVKESPSAKAAIPPVPASPVSVGAVIPSEKPVPVPPPITDDPVVPPAPSPPDRDPQSGSEIDSAAERREIRRKVYLSLYRMRLLDDRATKSRKFRKWLNNEAAEQLEIQRKLIDENREDFEAARKRKP